MHINWNFTLLGFEFNLIESEILYNSSIKTPELNITWDWNQQQQQWRRTWQQKLLSAIPSTHSVHKTEAQNHHPPPPPCVCISWPTLSSEFQFAIPSVYCYISKSKNQLKLPSTAEAGEWISKRLLHTEHPLYMVIWIYLNLLWVIPRPFFFISGMAVLQVLGTINKSV